MPLVLVLLPPLLILIALGLGVEADRARAGARDSGLLSLRVGTVALVADAALIGTAGCALWIAVAARSVGLDPFAVLPPLHPTLCVLGAALAVALTLDGATLAIGLYWEYGRAAAWWRNRSRLRGWLVRGPLCRRDEPLPAEGRRAVSRSRGLALAGPLLAFPLAIALGDGPARDLLLRGHPLVWGALGALVLQGLTLLVLALTLGDRSQPETWAQAAPNGPTLFPPEPPPPAGTHGPLYPAALSAGILIAIGVMAALAALVVPLLCRWGVPGR